ncbi:MAG: FAD-dependent oxidoreductase [Bacteroidia bacterium]|nr:FAD-dependent oxidoreductase [Bacteroidia bacterium]
MENHKKHYIAVIGGSISGSVAANLLANSGFRIVVFEMNALPYGKIEDGLPKWHIKLRNRQIKEIDNKLDHENIRYVPLVKIGRDLEFNDLLNNWGFSAIILANGAWQDREFPVPGIEKFRDRGLIYQNDFIFWFNHHHEADYQGKQYEIKDNAIIVGGGLASLDVVKICMIELVRDKLKEIYNIDEDMFKLEKYGIDKVLESHKVPYKKLNISGVNLVYRKNAEDMPLKSSKDESKASRDKARMVSAKLLNNYKEKYKFNFKPLRVPIDFIEEDDKLKGLVLQKVMVYNERIVPLENETEELRTDLIVSSIGSLPEQINGLQYEFSALKMKKHVDYHVYGYDNVFAVGNAVTGRGNIQESKQHGQKITRRIIDEHLTDDALESWLKKINNSIKETVSQNVESIIEEIRSKDIQPDKIIQSILEKTKDLNDKNGYTTYSQWVQRHLPVRLEEIPKNPKE